MHMTDVSSFKAAKKLLLISIYSLYHKNTHTKHLNIFIIIYQMFKDLFCFFFKKKKGAYFKILGLSQNLHSIYCISSSLCSETVIPEVIIAFILWAKNAQCVQKISRTNLGQQTWRWCSEITWKYYHKRTPNYRIWRMSSWQKIPHSKWIHHIQPFSVLFQITKLITICTSEHLNM